MQFLILTSVSSDSTEADVRIRLADEVQRVRELYGASIIRQIWQRGDHPGAALMIEATDEQEVRDALATLPLVAAGMLLTDVLVPLEPYAGFVGT